MCPGNEFNEIFIADFVLAQQHQLVHRLAAAAVGDIPVDNADIGPDNGFDIGAFTSVIKLDSTVHDPMIGNRDGGHLMFDRPFHQIGNASGRIQHAVMRVRVQMHERTGRSGHEACLLPLYLFTSFSF